MSNSSKRLIWIDLEMTGLDTFNDSILEIATVVTDADLEIVAEGLIWLFIMMMNGLIRWTIGIRELPRDLGY